jgi:hypothetical protein
MNEPWQVRAVWVSRDGSASEQQYEFGSYADARREVVRLFCHLGLVGHDDRALRTLEITGDYWSAPEAALSSRLRGPTIRPEP